MHLLPPHRLVTVCSMYVLLLLLCTFQATYTTATPSVSISNTVPRHFTNGSIFRPQDGNLFQHGDTWFYFGAAYGLCHEQPTGCANNTIGACGYGPDVGLMLASSPDLSMNNWTLVAVNLLPVDGRPFGVYFRPKLLYNAKNNNWVIWTRYVNIVGGGEAAQAVVDQGTFVDHYLVATSPAMTGPFTIVDRNASTYYTGGADDHVFIDSDGSAYIVYTSHGADIRLAVDKLTDDYTASAAAGGNTAFTSGAFGPERVESPSMFRRDVNGNPFYYVTMGHLCCFCKEGSNLWVYAATSPLGPFSLLTDIGNSSTAPGDSITHSQQNFIVGLPNGASGASDDGSLQYLFDGNRWQSAPDHIKDHDFHYWELLQWDDSTTPPTPLHLKGDVTTFTLTT